MVHPVYTTVRLSYSNREKKNQRTCWYYMVVVNFQVLSLFHTATVYVTFAAMLQWNLSSALDPGPGGAVGSGMRRPGS